MFGVDRYVMCLEQFFFFVVDGWRAGTYSESEFIHSFSIVRCSDNVRGFFERKSTLTNGGIFNKYMADRAGFLSPLTPHHGQILR